ncbi:MAG TPA: HPr(Ser) kinase/phosphatase [Gemmatimonadaceae bacterium]|nr:HPr(Ser) kinase/phosphatase [Gemmatimonadaceae bacterium]
MKRQPFTVQRLLELMRDPLQLELIGDQAGLSREITSSEVSSPGLVLAGYVERFPARRIQVFGETEIAYLNSLAPDRRRELLEIFFSFAVPCVVVTKAQKLPKELTEIAARAEVPVLRTALKTAEFYRRVKPALADEFAPSATLHGSLADVYGVGLLFIGQSGIGKSECVLDLVERGHRLVADDLVIATRRGNDIIIGRGLELQGHHMEIRGVGVIDVQAVFGIRAVRQQKRIEVVVQLEEWDKAAAIDRTGLDGATTTILDVEIPKVTIPLNPGKNITVVAEVVAMNHLLRYSGVDPAEAFNQRLITRMRSAADLRQYLAEDNE